MKFTGPALLATATLLLGALAACSASSGSGGATPREAVEDAIEAGIKGDHDRVCSLTLNEAGERLDEAETKACAVETKQKREEAEEQLKSLGKIPELSSEQEQDIKDFLGTDPKIGAENNGEVVVTYEFAGTPIPFTTKKIDGFWYVLAT